MKKLFLLIIGLSMSASLFAQQEKPKSGGACCAQGSSRAAMMAGVPKADVIIDNILIKDGKVVKLCEKKKDCEKNIAKLKKSPKSTEMKKLVSAKKSELNFRFMIIPSDIDLRQVKRRLDRWSRK